MKKSIFTVFLALLLCALTAVSVSAAELTFEDVTEDKWYYADVLTAVEAGLVNGRSETAFCPEENLTAAEPTPTTPRRTASSTKTPPGTSP